MWGACPVYGYQKSVANKNQLVPDDNTTPVVQQIFNLKLAGMSTSRIVAQLNQDCILSPLAYKKKMDLPHPRNGFADKDQSKWSSSTVLRILKDETYTGTLVQGKQYKLNYKIQKQLTRPASEWVRCEKKHDTIINIYDFEAVQRTLLMDTRTPPNGDIVSLFSGLLICGCCGGNMTRKMRRCGSAVYRYYYCPTGKRRGCHSPVMIAEDILSKAVFKEIRQHVMKAWSLSRQFENMNDEEIYQLLIKDKLVFKENVQKQLIQLKAFQALLDISASQRIICDVERADMDNVYAQEISQLEAEIAEAVRWIQAMGTHLDEHMQQIMSIAELVGCNRFDRADIVRLVKGIVVFSKVYIGVGFVLNF